MKLTLSHIIRRLEVYPVSKFRLHLSQSWWWREAIAVRTHTRLFTTRAKMEKDKLDEKMDYGAWTNEKLIARVTQLEAELKNKNNR